MKIISAKTDFCIKELLEDEIIRTGFISDVLDIPLEEIASTRLLNTHLWRKSRNEKLGILDVLVEMNNCTKINIEMQIRHFSNWDKRQIFYLAKVFTSDLRWGQNYKTARRCVAISILDFNLTDRKECHSVYRMRDQVGNELTDLLEIHTIELRKPPDENSRLKDWVRFFNAETEEELDMIKTSNRAIIRAMAAIRDFSLTRRIREEIELQEKFERDRIAMDEYAMEEGIKKGMEKGMQKGMEKGRQLAKTEDILQLLEEIGPVPEELHQQIQAQEDPETLNKWLKFSARAETLDEFIRNIGSVK
ncbi:MAG: Rpn family recombination-promoting nuclease/putative transposase [Acetatifactor sp.]|nr:Rpn family recombination-promoting nuclease/putative transposase [Acetatifactor sp.]